MKLFRNILTTLVALVACTLIASVSVVPASAQQGATNITQPDISYGTAFTIASGCATVSAIHGGPNAGSFATTASTCTPVITFAATAPNGWVCYAVDLTHPVVFTQTASTTTSCTVTATTTSGDTVEFLAIGF